MKHIGIFIFDGVEELDAVGPWEVLAWWTLNFPEDGYRVSFISRDGNSVAAAKGLTLVPHSSVTEAGRIDILLYPGGQGTRALTRDEANIRWVQELAETADIMTSVCTGSLVYAAAGLLQNRPATSYWDALDLLKTIDPTIDVRADERWVDDGDIITSAGVSAGIDMALHLVRRLVSSERASQTRRGIQYDPEPPVD